ncbi:amidohydrolase [Rhodococcus sp. 05-340-1]|jgi:Zn-dependent M28 family amino/carboxypeptidase|uniref:M28 family peptidase n=1 Tax=unclassified Rhodococcus (in: high G+C Gram-positive bacteria) TaxID=192944 RepID=UPI000B9B182A|nr:MULTISPECIES: M20/M25/M40 family metallo-hydrolase [unclassified Rhodococcus (in: high G+C Gram-positive bacteria)]OZD72468.1 amidohydrolase [Rhodococcus sp. 05-340-2]OZD76152.1 amidohydrolase [Rhodococcus sp. 05-340-1]OZF32658.1 amidohydrolase [Rhodococcus sp. 14-2483-1-2]
MRISLLAGSAVTVLILAGCSSTSDEEPARVFATPDGPGLSAAVTEDALVGHLEQLEAIAAENDGNRAAGTAGYDASVDYVVSQLESAGFEVTTPEFEFETFEAQTQTLSLAGTEIPVFALSYSPTTTAEGITARVVGAPAGADGCEATDYTGLDLAGAVAVVPRGVCAFGVKQTVAAELGAAAAIIVNNEPGPLDSGTLGDADTARIPTGGVSQEDGAAVLAAPEVTLTLVTETETTTSRNIIAQTTTGSTENVVVTGAHLDSVPEGPGINDNGTGTAAVLETALQMGSAPEVTNAVRFAFWGAEENGLVGSTKYVEGLSDEDKQNIALYLNFDMIGSHNAGYLAYDGDDSDQVGEPAGPAGSDAIERTFVEHLAAEDVAVDGTDFDGRSDYGPFIEVGIPAGGVFSGADENKTAAQAEKWGGTADQTFDENYHTDQDTLANVDRAALAKNGAAVAYGIGVYAQSVEGPNGVPVGAEREAARAEG